MGGKFQSRPLTQKTTLQEPTCQMINSFTNVFVEKVWCSLKYR
jgi:hypothetical protein